MALNVSPFACTRCLQAAFVSETFLASEKQKKVLELFQRCFCNKTLLALANGKAFLRGPNLWQATLEY